MDNAAQQCMRVSARMDIEAQNVTADHGQSIVFRSCGDTWFAPRKSKARGGRCLSYSRSRWIGRSTMIGPN